jgi:hypothetical protein
MANNFPSESNKMKLLTEYDRVAQKSLIWQRCSRRNDISFCELHLVFHKKFYFVVSGLKIIGHGNPDSNIESTCVTRNTSCYINY